MDLVLGKEMVLNIFPIFFRSPNVSPTRDVSTTEEGTSRGSPALSRSRTEVTGLITDFSLIQKFREKFMASELLGTYQAMLWCSSESMKTQDTI